MRACGLQSLRRLHRLATRAVREGAPVTGGRPPTNDVRCRRCSRPDRVSDHRQAARRPTLTPGGAASASAACSRRRSATTAWTGRIAHTSTARGWRDPVLRCGDYVAPTRARATRCSAPPSTRHAQTPIQPHFAGERTAYARPSCCESKYRRQSVRDDHRRQAPSRLQRRAPSRGAGQLTAGDAVRDLRSIVPPMWTPRSSPSTAWSDDAAAR